MKRLIVVALLTCAGLSGCVIAPYGGGPGYYGHPVVVAPYGYYGYGGYYGHHRW